MTLTALNERLFWIINGTRIPLGDYLMYLFTLSGESAAAAVVGFAALYAYRGFSRGYIVLFCAVLLLGGGIVHTIKQNVVADRPVSYFGAKDPVLAEKIHIPFERLRHRTFPSGHTQTAFGVAVFFSLLFRKHRLLWLGWACMVGISRVYLGVHFPVDVLAGAVVGAATAAGCYYLSMKKGWISPPRPKSAWFAWE